MNFSNLENFLSMFSDGKGYVDGKQIKTAYVGVNGVAKKMKKGYIGAINPVYRNLPSGYTQVEYIESSGTQYVNTGYKPNQNSRLTIDFEVNNTASSYRAIFGARDADLARCFSLFVSPTSCFYPNIGEKNDYYTWSSSLSILGRHIADANKNTITIDGQSYSFTSRTFQNDTTIYLFANNENGSMNMPIGMKLYSCQIYDDGTLVRDYVPCINPNGKIGLYDIAEGKFYENVGTGVFVAGTEITNSPVACLFFNGAVDPAVMAVSYSGNHTDEVVTMGNGKQYRLLSLTSSGTLTLEEEVQADVWVCNGGGTGSNYGVSSGSSGSGGSGGSFCNALAVTLPKSSTITVASAGGASNVSGITLSNWLAGSGGGTGAVEVGRGGKVGVGGAKAGGDTRPFADSYYTKYPCAGGGGGAILTEANAYGGGAGGSSTGAGASGGNTYTVNASGGVTGGGKGACSGSQATAGSYYGSGGGGGSGFYNYTLGKSGYQGLVVIRIPLEQSA